MKVLNQKRSKKNKAADRRTNSAKQTAEDDWQLKPSVTVTEVKTTNLTEHNLNTKHDFITIILSG